MSARASGYTALTFVASHGLERVDELVAALERAIALWPDAKARMTYGLPSMKGKKPKTFTWSAARAVSALSDPTLHTIGIWPDGYTSESWREGMNVSLYVHDMVVNDEFERRWSGLVLPTADGTSACLDFVRAAQRAFGIISAGIAEHAAPNDAQHEAYRGGDPRRCSPALVERIEWDGWKWRLSHTKLRRLYPITIIGPEIWAALPPMPRFDPMPTIEDLGDCKVLTAWPTLCDPRDPDFLRANRALRAWLWPFTIQNPADHVDLDPA
jgi:hypothetical protein